MTSIKPWLILIAIIFCMLLAGVFFLSRPLFYGNELEHSNVGMNLAKFAGENNFGGEFTLIRHDGQRISSGEYNYKLIYFGFTHCPEVCPATLKKMIRAIEILPPNKQQDITPILISVDPKRDTPDVMKKYVFLFDSHLQGFTGEPEDIEEVLSRYRVFAQENMDGMATEYGMNHTSFIYFTGQDDQVIGVFMPSHSPQEIARSIDEILN